MDLVVALLSQKSTLWWINQIGIILEIFGAALIVRSTFKSRAEIKNIGNTWGAELPTKLRDVIASQAITEFKGFALLAVGLFGQFIGSFK